MYESYTNPNAVEGENAKINDTKKVIEETNALKLFIKNYFNVPEKYVKYVAMIICHLASIIIFMIIYYLMLLDFDTYYFIPDGFPPEHFKNNKLLIAIFMSINFETTTAYVDIKLKNIIGRSFVMAQLCMTFLITFFVLLI